MTKQTTSEPAEQHTANAPSTAWSSTVMEAVPSSEEQATKAPGSEAGADGAAKGKDQAKKKKYTSPLGNPTIELPLLGKGRLARHLLYSRLLLGLGLLLFTLGVVQGVWHSQRAGSLYSTSSDATELTRRLGMVSSLALTGEASALQDAVNSAQSLADQIGIMGGSRVANKYAFFPAIAQRGEQIRASSELLQEGRPVLRARDTAFNSMVKLSTSNQGALLAVAQSGQTPLRERELAQQLMLALQAISGTAHDVQDTDVLDAENFALLSHGLMMAEGYAQQLRAATGNAQLGNILQTLNYQLQDSQTALQSLQEALPAVNSARDSLRKLYHQSNAVLQPLEIIKNSLAAEVGWQWWQIALILLGGLLTALGGWIMALAYIRAGRRRLLDAARVHEATLLSEQDAKRLNDANQAAILRLMNELLLVAEGDLTQEATVTEDITGAIADSVNYTIEELRHLVQNVHQSADKVTKTTLSVDATSTELLAASTEQLREIRETGRAVLEMAQRINTISGNAQDSAQVALQSRNAAESGLRAVQDSITGMNAIRAQIQESSKRIKRLGESSQEISEIIELISDITEQTNVLALNAAIQAASAGEAGRGFSIVAEEVQRLAERSADATRKIAELVHAIQSDTQDAVAAMERSTQGVVEGAMLADRAGTQLTAIDEVSRQLSMKVEEISSAALQEAALANQVTENIQHILAVTEQTSDGTRSTAQQVRALAHTAQELLQSIARFKIQ
ncbi:methyl-accepting chemotaxis protein [Vandammella animalimorsus]|uniref:Chemotaxis protein n=1 Tax=Vandammella animalimorsus TaxID=2029117 RepID=A0A2A2AYG0_9BURK|nr:methyl-accepting chemotaxis protein [Vandammella animalimorsus]PAT42807.1 chemotaxis protein [Vandammella animalimorsus]